MFLRHRNVSHTTENTKHIRENSQWNATAAHLDCSCWFASLSKLARNLRLDLATWTSNTDRFPTCVHCIFDMYKVIQDVPYLLIPPSCQAWPESVNYWEKDGRLIQAPFLISSFTWRQKPQRPVFLSLKL
jgi:hypothetical protein